MTKAGEKIRIDCPECGGEFEIIYKPKVAEIKNQKEREKQQRQLDAVRIEFCPACGWQIDEDDDELDEDDEEDLDDEEDDDEE